MNWNQQTVVITGAGSGMGRAYAVAFADKGCRLALCDISEQGLETTAKTIRERGAETPLLACFDVADENAVQDFADRVDAQMGGATMVINNAGIEGAGRPAWALSSADHQRVMNVNYYGVLWCSQAFLPQLMQKKQSYLINVSSVFGLVGTPNNSDYCASKFAVRGYTEALMSELHGSSVQVICVHPGGIATDIARQERSRDFSKQFLRTPPEAMTKALIRTIEKGQSRLVYGHSAASIAWAARLLPVAWVSKILWSKMRDHIDRSDYTIVGKQK